MNGESRILQYICDIQAAINHIDFLSWLNFTINFKKIIVSAKSFFQRSLNIDQNNWSLLSLHDYFFNLILLHHIDNHPGEIQGEIRPAYTSF